ncbi:MAG TPA: hypothetical protein VLI46_16110 [Ramlibacter sp.]|nr:hypothetical protein [Ramlibacter sp.]
MLKTPLAIAMISAAALGLSACDVKKTQEGNVTVPQYEVQKKAEGDVTLPKYDVKTPDVQVGSTEKTITVPTVKTEEKKIEVPTVTVTPADQKK